jgi:hypothetical protein
MVDLTEIQAAYYLIAATGVIGTLTAAFIAVRTYINTNKRAEESRARELETRQAQMFMNIYEQTKSDEFTAAIYKILVDSKWSTFDEYWKNWNTDPEFRRMSDTLGWFYEGLGVLVREGMLDVRWVALLICSQTREYWERYLPIVKEARERMPWNRRWWSESEYLYMELMKYLEEHPELDSRISNPLYNAQ